MDRKIDKLTPLIIQHTYSGLIDELYDIDICLFFIFSVFELFFRKDKEGPGYF